jgi:hypothetical protein
METCLSKLIPAEVSAASPVSPDVSAPSVEAEIGATPQRVDKGTQLLLMLKYRDLAREGKPLPTFHEAAFHHFSQNGEDGILLLLFAVLGTTNCRCVEICAGDCIECNTANFIVNYGWRGLMVDGSAQNIARGRDFYSKRRDGLRFLPPTMVQAWITRDNINGLLSQHLFCGEIDLLSLDIDGNDYWIWESIDVIQPRIIVAEYDQSMGNHSAVTVPYREDFVWDGKSNVGASLPAMVKLGKTKGYRLVGTDTYGINAFFVRNGIGEQLFPEVSAASIPFPFGSNPDLTNVPLVTV